MSQNSTNKFLFIDIETNGLPLNYNKHYTDIGNWPRIVQIAWIICDDKKEVITERCFIIKPIDFDIPDNVVIIHGITKQIALAKGLPISFVLNLLEEESKDCTHFVAHNIAFDAPIIKAEFLRANVEFSLNDKTEICTMQSSIEYCGFTNNKYPKLEELYFKLFNKKPENLHDALQDIKYTKDCFFELVKLGFIFLKHKINKVQFINSDRLKELMLFNNKKFPKLIPYRKINKWGYINNKLEVTIECIYKDAELFNENKISYTDKVVINENGNIIATKFGFIRVFKNIAVLRINSNNLNKSRNNNYDYNIINSFGIKILPFNFPINHVKDNLFSFVYEQKYGLFDFFGNNTLSFWYHSISVTSNGLIIAEYNYEYRLFNNMGLLLTQFIYDSIDDFFCDRSKVCRNNKYGFIDTNGNEIIECIYDYAQNFSEDIAIVKTKGSSITQILYINSIGEVIYKYEIRNINDYGERPKFVNGIAAVNGKIVDKEFNIILDWGNYCLQSNFNCGLFIIRDCLNINNRDIINRDIYNFVNSKFGCIDIYGNFIVPFIYDYIYDFIDNIAIVTLNGKKGAIDNKGNLIIDFIYDDIFHFTDGIFTIFIQKKFMYLNKNGTEFINKKYDHLTKFENGFGLYSLGNKNGIIYNNNGNGVELELGFQNLKPFGKFLKFTKDFKVGLINIFGDVILNCLYDDILYYTDDKNLVKVADKYIININDKTIQLPSNILNIEILNDCIIAKSKEKKGYLSISEDSEIDFSINESYIKNILANKNKEQRISCEGKFYTYSKSIINNLNNGYYLVKSNNTNKYGYVNENGVELIPCIYRIAYDFYKGYASIYNFIINEYGIEVSKKYDSIEPILYEKNNFSMLYKAKLDNKYCILDYKGKLLCDLLYSSIGNFSEQKIIVSIEDKYGFIDNNGNLIIECKYDLVGSFSEGLAFVKKNDKSFYIDSKGEIVFEIDLDVVLYRLENGAYYENFKFSNWFEFKNGISLFKSKENIGMLDKNGKIILSLEIKKISEDNTFDSLSISHFNDSGLAVLTEGEFCDYGIQPSILLGCIDYKGNMYWEL